MKTPLTEAEQEQIRKAVAQAESRTSGEIVPYIMTASDRYEVAVWRGAAALALVAVGVVLLLHQFYDGWYLAWLFTGWGVALLALVAGTLGAVLGAYVRPLKRMLAGAGALDRAVHRRALQAFVEEEVFDTRDRTGILLFISLLEHRIEVVGDTGINRLVAPEDWVNVVARVRGGIKSGHLAEGLLDAVEMCGALLERSGVKIQPDDVNELPNRLRIRHDV